MPIVHGLEKRYRGRIDFVYLHVGEPRNAEVKRRLGFKSTPHIMLLRADGTKVTEWVGAIEEHHLTVGLDALVPA